MAYVDIRKQKKPRKSEGSVCSPSPLPTKATGQGRSRRSGRNCPRKHWLGARGCWNHRYRSSRSRWHSKPATGRRRACTRWLRMSSAYPRRAFFVLGMPRACVFPFVCCLFSSVLQYVQPSLQSPAAFEFHPPSESITAGRTEVGDTVRCLRGSGLVPALQSRSIEGSGSTQGEYCVRSICGDF